MSKQISDEKACMEKCEGRSEGGDLTPRSLHARVALGVALRRVAVWGEFQMGLAIQMILWGRDAGHSQMVYKMDLCADLICDWSTHQSSQNGRRAERRSRYSQWLFSFPRHSAQIYSKSERFGASITYLECHKRNMVSMGQPEFCYLFWNYFQPCIPTSDQQAYILTPDRTALYITLFSYSKLEMPNANWLKKMTTKPEWICAKQEWSKRRV